VIFDHGEHDIAMPSPEEETNWRCRPDPFSNYRPCFEVRTYRLCSRVLMFHHFPHELGVQSYLVRSTDFHFSCDDSPADPLSPNYTYLESATQAGYVLQNASTSPQYLRSCLPPIEFKYTQTQIDPTLHDADASVLENLPAGVDGVRYRWVDLDGEGSPGILSEQAASWYYKRNTSNLPHGQRRARARFEATELVATLPLDANLAGGSQQLLDLAGDGNLYLARFDRSLAGYYERDESSNWTPFVPFKSQPNINWREPNMRMVDLSGDGFADVLITEQEVFAWYPSWARGGFGEAQTVRKPFDEDRGPALVFADGTQSIYLADMSGDGQKDLVRVRNGEVCYWPNLGYGRFGSRIAMDSSPVIDTPDLFDQKRVRLADIDGSGTCDLIYLGRQSVRIWLNQSGNSWTPVEALPNFQPSMI
jgi:Salmonella virulence plasmid 65kDa B protein